MTVTEESAHQKTLTETALGLRHWCRGEIDRRMTARLVGVAVEIAFNHTRWAGGFPPRPP